MSKANPTVYLAGPITGLSFDNCTEWRAAVAQKLAPITCFSPLRCKQYLQDEKCLKDSYLNHVLSRTKSINERDHFDCKSCDLIFVNLLGADRVSIGTIMEVAWGFAYRKPVVLAIDPKRNYIGVPEAERQANNPNHHSMLIESASFVVDSLDDAILVTRSILFPNDAGVTAALYCG